MQSKLNRLMIGAVFVAALAGGAPEASLAQDSRSVVIRDGTVILDGRRLPDDSVPESLRQFEGNVNFTFSGEEEPLIGFGSRTYRIENERIVELPSSPFAFTFPGDAVGKARSFAFQLNMDSLQLDQSLEKLKHQMHELRIAIPQVEVDSEQLARDMSELRSSLGALKEFTVPEDVFHLRRHMPRARVFKPFDVEVYMDEIREVDRSLYEQLLSERELEDESIDLARRLQEAGSDAERAALAEELRQHLEEVFEVRQENRRDEIRRLESKIENLRRRVESREAMRERIIQNRLEFLIEEE